MIRQQISAKTGAMALIIALGVVLAVYWNILIKKEPPGGGGGGGGGPMMGPVKALFGEESVRVETFSGGRAGSEDGPAWRARFFGPAALAWEPSGALLVADSLNDRIRRIDPQGKVETVLNSDLGNLGRLSRPAGVAALSEGGLVVADTGNHRLLQVDGSGKVSLLAGGRPGTAEGIGAAAAFRFPGALAVADGAVWVADHGNNRIRRITLAGQVSSPTAVPGDVKAQLGDVGPARLGPKLVGGTGNGAVSVSEWSLNRRSPGARASTGVVFYADPILNLVVVGQLDGTQRVIAGRVTDTDRPEPPFAIENRRPIDVSGDKAVFLTPSAVALGPDGRLYVADFEGNAIRRIEMPGWLASNEAPPPPRPRRRRFGGS